MRQGVGEAIDKLYEGGVNVRMISGDHLKTAIEVAKKAGILKPEEVSIDKVCMEGKEFRSYVGGTRKVID